MDKKKVGGFDTKYCYVKSKLIPIGIKNTVEFLYLYGFTRSDFA